MKSGLLMGVALGVIGQLMAHPLKPNTLMTLPIACGGLLRVAIKGDFIQDVVIYPEKLAERMTLHKSGQFFLDTKGLSQPVTVTIMTQRNVTQDLKLYCDAKCKTGPLLLEPEEKDKPPLKVEDPKLEHIIRRIMSDELEKGTRFPRGSHRTREDLVWKGHKYWEVDHQLLERYETRNETSRVIILRAEAFKESDDVAISFDREFLEPNQKAVMVVVRKKTINPQKGDIQ